MAKIDISKASEIIKKNAVEPAITRRIIEEMNLAVQPDPTEDEKPLAVKKQFVVLVSDPEWLIKTDLVAWVLQIPESESPATTLERVFSAAYQFNTSKKGQLLPAHTVGDAIENIQAKFFKEMDLWVKTRTPVLVVRTNNEIPKE